MGSTEPRPRGRAADGSDWNRPPPGHLSLSEAARRTGYSTERIRQLAEEATIASTRIPFGRRVRVWLPEEAIHDLQSARARRGPPGLHADVSRGASAPEEGERDAIMRDRDRWRSETLRLRAAGLHMSAALDVMNEASEHRAAAEESLSAAAASLKQALEKSHQALSLQSQALREFMIPGDVDEN